MFKKRKKLEQSLTCQAEMKYCQGPRILRIYHC